MKILAEVNLDKPILCGSNIRLQDHEVWVEFKYESMAMFCFYCGKVGHSERSCTVRKNDVNAGRLSEEQYGEWLKANITRCGVKQPNGVIKERMARIGLNEKSKGVWLR